MPDERRSYLRRAAGAAKNVAGTLGEGVRNIKEDISERRRQRQFVTDQEQARLERAEEEARQEAIKEARQEFRNEYREEIRAQTREEQLRELRQRYGMLEEEVTQQQAEEREAQRRDPFIPGVAPPPSDGDADPSEPYVPMDFRFP